MEGRPLGDVQRRADHHFSEALGGLDPRIAGRDQFAAAQHCRLRTQHADLVELVRDIEDRAPLGGEPAQGCKQRVGFLRRQHRGRLVHDDQTRILQQATYDLDPLALADRQRTDQTPRLEVEAIGARHRDDARPQGVVVRLTVEPERDVLRNGQRIEQREMLEHHADAARAGIERLARLIATTIDVHGALVGLQHAIDHLDQRRLAGAVFSEQCVDRAAGHVERDVIDGFHARKRLRQACEAQYRWHCAALAVHGLALRTRRSRTRPGYSNLRDGCHRDRVSPSLGPRAQVELVRPGVTWLAV